MKYGESDQTPQSVPSIWQGPTGGAPPLVPVAGAPLPFEEWGILDGSWAMMKPVTAAVLEELASGGASREGELQGLRGMIEAFEGMLAVGRRRLTRWHLS